MTHALSPVGAVPPAPWASCGESRRGLIDHGLVDRRPAARLTVLAFWVDVNVVTSSRPSPRTGSRSVGDLVARHEECPLHPDDRAAACTDGPAFAARRGFRCCLNSRRLRSDVRRSSRRGRSAAVLACARIAQIIDSIAKGPNQPPLLSMIVCIASCASRSIASICNRASFTMPAHSSIESAMEVNKSDCDSTALLSVLISDVHRFDHRAVVVAEDCRSGGADVTRTGA